MGKRITTFILICMLAFSFQLTSFADNSPNKSITSIEIKRVYQREEMDISQDAFSLEVSTWHVSADYEIVGEPSLNDPITYAITLMADDGYDFHGLKIGSCKSTIGTFTELELSEDRKYAYITFLADPPEIILASPQNLRWKGSYAAWNPVEYALEYEVTLQYITNNGKLSSTKIASVTTDKCSHDFAKELFLQPHDYVFTVIAHPDPTSSFIKSRKATLDFEKSYMVTEEDLGIYDGRWVLNKQGEKCYKVDGEFLTTGLYRIEGYHYLLAESGAVQYGWQLLDDTYYYFDPTSGIMLTGLQTIEEVRYLFDDRGRMLTGWQTIDNLKYYASDQGDLVTGWQQIGGYYYYFYKDGHLNLNRSLLSAGRTLCTFDTESGILIGTYKLSK